MITMLSISPVCPYDSIGHAGGKTFNYYLKKISQKDCIQIKVLLFGNKEEINKCDLAEYKISFDSILTSGNLNTDIEHFFLDILGRLFFKIPCQQKFSLFKLKKIIEHLKRLKKSDALPEIIELEWTDFVYYAKYIKQNYPQIKIIASEHDVTYLGLQRKGLSAKKLARAKKQELEALQNCDAVMTQNIKDKNLLIQDGIPEDKIHVIVPYYHDMGYIERKKLNHDILFWGAMYRPENYEAAIWFIENVMPLLEDLDVRFVVAGNRPPEKLKRYASRRVLITGFVENETPLFESSMCFVSPLLTGAGIKVKVIEALSARIPILTNDIGIEGIPAVNGESYFYCKKPEDYASVIRDIYAKKIDTDAFAKKQHEVIEKCFDLNSAFEQYMQVLLCLKGKIK